MPMMKAAHPRSILLSAAAPLVFGLAAGPGPGST
jgi:hypothetical protein